MSQQQLAIHTKHNIKGNSSPAYASLRGRGLLAKVVKSYVEAQQYAKEKGLLCLAMDGKTFNKAFQIKIEAFKDHPKYAYLKKQADNAIIQNMGAGFSSIRANDFMKRIIVLPKDYIRDWLDGKNKLEWLEEYK